MKLPKYPLEQLVLIKAKRLEEAEKKLKEKKAILEKEQAKLKKLEEESQKVFDHKMEKIKQLNDEMAQGTTSNKIEIADRYLKVVEEDLKQKKKKVLDQDKVVKVAISSVELARIDMIKKQHDLEKLEIHRAEWKKGVLRELEHKESLEGEEIGSAKFSMLQREKKQKKKE